MRCECVVASQVVSSFVKVHEGWWCDVSVLRMVHDGSSRMKVLFFNDPLRLFNVLLCYLGNEFDF